MDAGLPCPGARRCSRNLAARKLAWIWEFLTELGFALPPLKVDNVEAAVSWSTQNTRGAMSVWRTYDYVNDVVAVGRIALDVGGPGRSLEKKYGRYL